MFQRSMIITSPYVRRHYELLPRLCALATIIIGCCYTSNIIPTAGAKHVYPFSIRPHGSAGPNTRSYSYSNKTTSTALNDNNNNISQSNIMNQSATGTNGSNTIELKWVTNNNYRYMTQVDDTTNQYKITIVEPSFTSKNNGGSSKYSGTSNSKGTKEQQEHKQQVFRLVYPPMGMQSSVCKTPPPLDTDQSIEVMVDLYNSVTADTSSSSNTNPSDIFQDDNSSIKKKDTFIPTALFVTGDDNNCTINDVLWNVLQLNVYLPSSSSIQFLILPTSNEYFTNVDNNQTLPSTTNSSHPKPPYFENSITDPNSKDIVEFYYDDISIIFVSTEQASDIEFLIHKKTVESTQQNNTSSPYLFEKGNALWNLRYVISNGTTINNDDLDFGQDDWTNSGSNTKGYSNSNNSGSGSASSSSWFGVINMLFIILITMCLLRSYCVHRRRLADLQLQREMARANAQVTHQQRNDSILSTYEFEQLPIIPYKPPCVSPNASSSSLNHNIKTESDEVKPCTANGTSDKLYVDYDDNALTPDSHDSQMERVDEETNGLVQAPEDDDIESGVVRTVNMGRVKRRPSKGMSVSTTPSTCSDVDEYYDDDDNDVDDNDRMDEIDKETVSIMTHNEGTTRISPGASSSDNTNSCETSYENTGDHSLATNVPTDSDKLPTDSDEEQLETAVSTTCTMCPICIDDFVVDEQVLVLPKCNHAFHPECIKQWLLEKQGCCPLCKSIVLSDAQLEQRQRRQNELQQLLLQQQQSNDHGSRPTFIVVIDSGALRTNDP